MQDEIEKDWMEVEEDFKQQWLNQNKNPILQWEDVKASVYFGWRLARKTDASVQSIH